MEARTQSLSIVIPAHNEAGSIAALHSEVVEVCEKQGYEYEIIIVDDGSTDGTAEVVRGLTPVVYVRLRRNFGQTSAMDAGIKQASKGHIITMDGDGQNDPADIPRLVEHLEATGVDVVSGWRKSRKDPLAKRAASRLAHIVRRKLISDGIHDSGCSLKIYRNECFRGIHLYGEMHRFIPAVLRIKGFSISEIEVNHRPRTSGTTKYNWRRGIKGLIDMVSVWFWHKYAVRPLHLLGSLGVLGLFLGFATSVIGIYRYFAGFTAYKNMLPIVAVFFLISGIQLFVFGLIADMLAKQYFGTSDDSAYSIAEVSGRTVNGNRKFQSCSVSDLKKNH